MSVVLSMITKNSFSELKNILFETLNASLQIPYIHFILVDDSRDETSRVIREWCKENNKEIYVLKSKRYGYYRTTRATARQTAIDFFLENFKSEWLMFLDDDAVLNPGWWEEARIHIMDERVGLIWGLNYDALPTRKRYLDMLGIDYVAYLKRQFEVRGGTHDTLLRRKAIEDIKIPPALHIFEDAYIKRWVEYKGWECRILSSGVCHKNLGREPGMQTLKLMAEWGLKLGLEDPKYKNRFFCFYALARSTAGFPLTILLYIKRDGVKGVSEGMKRAKTKWLYRLLLWLYSLRIKPPTNFGEALEKYADS